MKTQEATREAPKSIDLRVAGGSNTQKVAGAIVKYMDEGNQVSLVALGAGAVNQAVKAVAVARGMAATSGRDLYCIPSFTDEIVDGVRKSAIVIKVRDRS